MNNFESKINEIHVMLTHLMKEKPYMTGSDVKDYLGVNSLAFMDIIIDEDANFPKAVKIDGKISIFECEWRFSSIASWKKKYGYVVEHYQNTKVIGDINARIKDSYNKVKNKS